MRRTVMTATPPASLTENPAAANSTGPAGTPAMSNVGKEERASDTAAEISRRTAFIERDRITSARSLSLQWRGWWGVLLPFRVSNFECRISNSQLIRHSQFDIR